MRCRDRWAISFGAGFTLERPSRGGHTSSALPIGVLFQDDVSDGLYMVTHELRRADDVAIENRFHDITVVACGPRHEGAGRQRQTPIAIETIVKLRPEVQQRGRAAFRDQRKVEFAVARLPE